MELDSDTIVRLFQFAPAVIALLIVIYLQHKQLMRKDELVKSILEITDADTQRQSKLMALLEILVNRREEG